MATDQIEQNLKDYHSMVLDQSNKLYEDVKNKVNIYYKHKISQLAQSSSSQVADERETSFIACNFQEITKEHSLTLQKLRDQLEFYVEQVILPDLLQALDSVRDRFN